MKIIITTASPSIESEVDSRFGRGAYLLAVDPNTLEWQAHPNLGVGAPGGAGIQAAQFVTQQKADAVISGDFGPHAFDALNAANVPMYLFGTSRTARDVIARFNAGQLQRIGAATREDCHHAGGK
jgi:predicted Fe-Mo cluster-binding NifX family protein